MRPDEIENAALTLAQQARLRLAHALVPSLVSGEIRRSTAERCAADRHDVRLRFIETFQAAILQIREFPEGEQYAVA